MRPVMTGVWKRTLLLAALAVPGWGAAQTPDTSRLEPLLRFAQRYPQDVALLTYTVRPDRTPDLARPHFGWNADQFRPLEGHRRLLVLAAYAQALKSGKVNPQQTVTLGQWESYAVKPAYGPHEQAMRALGMNLNAQGAALNPEQPVPLDTLARFMLDTQDDSAMDALLVRLGPQALPATFRAWTLNGVQNFGPQLGQQGNWATPDSLTSYAALPLEQRVALDWRKARQLSSGVRERQNLYASPSWPSYRDRLKLYELTTPRGTLQDVCRLLASVQTGVGWSGDELTVLRRNLRVVLPVGSPVLNFGEVHATPVQFGLAFTFSFGLTWRDGPRAGEHVVAALTLSNVAGRADQPEWHGLPGSLADALLLVATQPDQARRLMMALKP